MTKYAHIKNGSVVKLIDLTAAQIADLPAHKQTYIVPVVGWDTARPIFDSNTHKGSAGRVVDIQANQVVYSWLAPTALTAQEIDDRNENEVNEVDRKTTIALFKLWNKVRVLEGDTEITKAQFLTAWKAL